MLPPYRTPILLSKIVGKLSLSSNQDRAFAVNTKLFYMKLWYLSFQTISVYFYNGLNYCFLYKIE